MFFKKRIKNNENTISFAADMKKELISSLKKVGLDISEVNIDMRQDNLSVAVYVENNASISHR